MELHLIRDFDAGNIEIIDISPAILAIDVEPRVAGEADRILMVHSAHGRFDYVAGPYPGRFRIEIGEAGDLDSVGGALIEISELSGGTPPIYVIRDLIIDLSRRRDEAILMMETDIIDDEIALGLYGDEDP